MEQFLRCFGRKAGDQVGGSVRAHLLNDVGGLFGVEFLDNLGLQALVEFGESFGCNVLIEGINDRLTFGGRELLHEVGEIGRVEFLEPVARNAQLHAAERIGFDQVDELPADRVCGKLLLNSADRVGRDDSLQEAANRRGDADADIFDAKLRVAVRAVIAQVHVIDADHLATMRVDDLLVEKVFPDRQPGFIWMEEFERGLVGGEVHLARGDGADLVVASDQGTVTASAEKQA
jgi:hypothetical protein